MARPKGAKSKKKHVFQDPQIEEIVEQWIEFICPKRGKVRQLVKVKRLKKAQLDIKTFVGPRDLIEDLESKEDNSLADDIQEE